MTAPIADEVLTLADGRLLGWAEWGDPRGAPLVFLHPSPGSRVLCPDPAATLAAGVRLITVDRPGYGRSDPVGAPTLESFARDLERLLDHLWLGQVPLVGWFSGGQYAVACAAALVERVSALALVATPAPDREVCWLPAALRKLADLAAHDPDRGFAAAVEWAATLAAAPEVAGHGWDSPPDLAARARPEVQQAFTAMWGEAFRCGSEGLAADLVAVSRPWGFDPGRVQTRTALFYGAQDLTIGPAHGRWWAHALPQAWLTIRPDSGHLVPFAAWADILTAMADPAKVAEPVRKEHKEWR